MKKDFQQPFETTPTQCELLVQDAATDQFLLLQGLPESMEEDWHRSFSFTLEPQQQLSQQLTKYLYDERFIVINYREIGRLTTVNFSFADDTPGEEVTEICLHVVVDIMDDAQFNRENAHLVRVPLSQLAGRLSNPYPNGIVTLGIVKLFSESAPFKKANTLWRQLRPFGTR